MSGGWKRRSGSEVGLLVYWFISLLVFDGIAVEWRWSSEASRSELRVNDESFRFMMLWLTEIKKFVLDTLFPIECLGCRKEGEWLCGECLRKIRPDAHSLCGESLDKILTFYSYDREPLIKQAIHLLKYKFVEDLAGSLGALFINELQKVSQQIGREAILIPVPLHKKRRLERGFNQSELLALKIKEKFGWQLERGALARVRNTTPQVDLAAEERQENIRDAFAVRDPSKIIDKKIILIDDVFTTGATMEECAKVLKAAGAKEVWATAVARG